MTGIKSGAPQSADTQSSEPPREETDQAIAAWLQRLGLEQYAKSFVDNAIGIDVLPVISDHDLEKIGVLLGHRRKILKAIADDPDVSVRSGSHQANEAERRYLTVLFCDLVDSTKLATQLDPEAMREVVRGFQDTCAGSVTRYDGFVAQFLGDGVLVYFGYPRAHEGDAERAVRAALEICAALERHSAPDGMPLHARIGIATGLVVVGDLVGQGAVRERAVVGDAPYLAARLQQLAKPGGIVLAESTRKLLGRRFELRDVGGVDLKGFGEQVRAYVVVGVARFETRFESEHETELSSFVGRESEIALLSACWDAVTRGEGRVALISGEAGIGKSRLIAHLEQGLPQQSHALLRYQCLSFQTTSALHPFIHQLRRAADLDENTDVALQLDRIQALVAGSMSPVETERVAPLFADLLSISIDGRYPALHQSAAQRRRQLLTALLDYLASLARKQPLVVFFEDLHWADATTLEVLNLLVERIRWQRILLLMTCRPDFKPPWAGGSNAAVALGRLEPASVRTLITSLAREVSLPTSIVEQIAANTDGVPLFVEELTRMVLESGPVTQEAERSQLPGPGIGIPATLQDSMMARLDRMAPVRNVAQIAAAIGREFSFQLLHKLAGRDVTTLNHALARLKEAGLLLQTSPAPNAHYRFKHSLLQNAAYQTLLKSTRRVLHARIATILCNQFPIVAETEPEVIAYHFTRAGRTAPQQNGGARRDTVL